jgi:hypothetical protein
MIAVTTSATSRMMKTWLQATRRVMVRTVVGTTLVVATVEVTTQLPSQGRASWFYHYLADDVATPLLRKFLQPESECVRFEYCNE